MEDLSNTQKTNNANKQKTIGIVIDTLGDNHYRDIMESLFESSEYAGFNIVIFTCSNGYYIKKEYQQVLFYNQIESFLLSNRLDGLIIFNGNLNYFYTETDINDSVKKIKDIPIISLNTRIDNAWNILIDNHAGIVETVQHLIKDHGCRKIAFIKGEEDHNEALERLQGYMDGLKQSGLTVEEKYIFEGGFDDSDGRTAAKKIVETCIEELDAVIAADDNCARGCLLYFQEYGLSVPWDIKVCGFNNDSWSGLSSPTLTTVHQSYYKQGEQCIEILKQIFSGQNPVKEIRLLPKLIKRESCGCFLTEYSNEQDFTINEYEKYKETFNIFINSNNQQGLNKLLFNLIKNRKKNCFSLRKIQHIIFSLKNDNNNKYRNHMIQNAKFFIEREALKSDHLDSLISYEQRRHLTSTSYQFTAVNSFKELFDSMYSELPGLGIMNSSMVLLDIQKSFEDIEKLGFPKTGNLVFYCKNGHPSTHPQSKNFLNKKIHPFDKFKEQKIFIFHLLNYQNVIYGYIIFEYSPDESKSIYEILSSYISAAIRRILLKEELHKSIDQRTNFFINLGHELKTPLTIIENYMERFLQKTKNDVELTIIQQNVSKMKRDVLNFLDMVKIERGMPLYDHKQKTDATYMLLSVLPTFKSYASKDDITVISDLNEIIYVSVDPIALERIFYNLLDNAVKHNISSGFINITLCKKDGNLELIISNSSNGIPQNQLFNIFQPFFQLSEEKNPGKGIGMGLHLIKSILETVGGSINVTTGNNKTDIIFTVLLPATAAINKQEQKLVEYYDDSDMVIDISNSKYREDKSSILIVEDNKHMLSFLKLSLQDQYNIFCTLNGKAALKQLQKQPLPNLIISDIMMDQMDGYDFLKVIKKQANTASIPFIFLTAKTDETFKGLELGAMDFIIKPFQMDELAAKIKSIINQQTGVKQSMLNKVKKDISKILTDSIKYDYNNRLQSSLNFELTKQQLKVASYLVMGMQYKEIASELKVSIYTVHDHIKEIYKRTQAKNRMELIGILKNYLK